MNNISTSSIAFHTPTKEEYNKILDLIDKKDNDARWWNTKDKLSNKKNSGFAFDGLGSFGSQTCIGYNSLTGNVAVGTKFVYEKCGIKILSVDEAIQYIRNIKI